MDIQFNKNCGNSPKQEFLKRSLIGVMNSNFNNINTSITDIFSLNLIGNSNLINEEQLFKSLNTNFSKNVKELQVDSIITHGREVALREIVSSEIKYMALVYKSA